MGFFFFLFLVIIVKSEYCYGNYQHGHGCQEDYFIKAVNCYEMDDCYGNELDDTFQKLVDCDYDKKGTFTWHIYSDSKCQEKDFIREETYNFTCHVLPFFADDDFTKICNFNRTDSLKFGVYEDDKCKKHIRNMYIRKGFCKDAGETGVLNSCSKDGEKMELVVYNSSKCTGDVVSKKKVYKRGECISDIAGETRKMFGLKFGTSEAYVKFEDKCQ